MWQEVIVSIILAVAAGVTIWKFYRKLTGKASCCGSDSSCSGSCSTAGGKSCCGCADEGRILPAHPDKTPPR